MAALDYLEGTEVTSLRLSKSLKADRTFVRRSLAKLAKAGLVFTTRGRNGTCSLARPASEITLLDIYRASEAPAAFAIHSYEVEPKCPVSVNFKVCLRDLLNEAQTKLEQTLAKRSLAEVSSKMKRLSK